MKILICGASARCISIVAKDFLLSNSDNEIIAFLDNDKLKINMKINSGYYYHNNKKVYFPLNNIPVDAVNNAINYEFDYIFIVSAFFNELYLQLINLGITPDKIIIYKRDIENGKTRIPLLGSEETSFSSLLKKHNLSPTEYANELNTLYDVCKKVLKNKYRLELLSLIRSAVEASVNQTTFTWNNVKLSYKLWDSNPSLFIYEAADILFDVLCEEMDDIEYIEGPYELGNVKIESDDIILDIGANYGLFSAIAATKAPSGYVYAFEPVSATKEILNHTVSQYGNIDILPYAASNHSGYVDISTDDYEKNPGRASIMNTQSTSTQKVPCISLDDFVIKHNIAKIDFIKADIEGAERLLLLGSQTVLSEMAPKLAICTYHYPEDPKLLEYLIHLANPNYVIEKFYGKLYAYVPSK